MHPVLQAFLDTNAARILPPTVAYAAGLICEHRPDLADGVRAAVLSDIADHIREVRFLKFDNAADRQAAEAVLCLRDIYNHPDEATKTLGVLADVLFDSFRWYAPTPQHADLAFPLMYFRRGFAPCWEHAKTPNDLRCLRRLITLHAHTVSLDATVRAAWAKAHLDALTPPARSPPTASTKESLCLTSSPSSPTSSPPPKAPTLTST